MSELLFIVEVGYREIIIHKVNVINGDYLRPHIIKFEEHADFIEITNTIVYYIMKEKPDKIIFDRLSCFGQEMYEAFSAVVYKEQGFKIDAFGTVIYKGVDA